MIALPHRTRSLTQRTSTPYPRRYLRAPTLGCAFALLAAGCAERYQIGQLGDTPLELQGAEGADSDQFGVLLVAGPEDGDAVLGGNRWPQALGDMDGDGYDDIAVAREGDGAPPEDAPGETVILYGGPRPLDGVVHTPPERTTTLLHAALGHSTLDFVHGDADGDGHLDLLGSGMRNGLETGPEIPSMTLWYGVPGRPAVVDMEQSAVRFGISDELVGRLRAEVVLPRPGDDEVVSGGDETQMNWIGDLDGDGCDDLVITDKFTWWFSRAAPELVGVEAHASTGTRTDGVSFVYYGKRERFGSDGTVPQPDARVPGAVQWGAIGDVNGDGFADVQVASGDAVYIVPGRAQRLSGTVSLPELGGVRLAARQPPSGWRQDSMMPRYPAWSAGDVDQDGLDDFVLDYALWDVDLFYGSPELFAGTITASATFSTDGEGYIRNIGDWNGDGANDLLFWSFVHMEDRDSFFAPRAATPPGGQSPSEVPTATTEARLLPGGPVRYAGRYDPGIFRPELESVRGYHFTPVQIGDVDGDGRGDLTFQSYAEDWLLRFKYGAPLADRSVH